MNEIKVVTDEGLSLDKIEKIALRRARLRNINKMIKVEETQKVYKRFFFLKILASASRYPFKSKKIDYVIFSDTVLTKSGLTDGVPRYQKDLINKDKIIPSKYSREDFAKDEDKLIQRFILKQFLLKRPEISKEGVEEVYLPYWKSLILIGNQKEYILLNACTGKKDM